MRLFYNSHREIKGRARLIQLVILACNPAPRREIVGITRCVHQSGIYTFLNLFWLVSTFIFVARAHYSSVRSEHEKSTKSSINSVLYEADFYP